MKKQKKKYLIINIFFAITLIVGVIGIFGYSQVLNNRRSLKTIDNYISELAQTTAKNVDHLFDADLAAIKVSSSLYGTSLDSDEVDYELLKLVEQSSIFDGVRFIDLEGNDYTSDKQVVNISDRDYFKLGIKGKSGISYLAKSRITGKKLICFYAPVYYQENIIGVMLGYFDEMSISNYLASEIFNFTADTLVVNQDLEIVGEYYDDTTFFIANVDQVLGMMKESEQTKLVEGLKKHQIASFKYGSLEATSIGYVVPLAYNDWSLVQLFPADASRLMKEETGSDELHVYSFLAGLLGSVFIVFIVLNRIKYLKEYDEEIEAGRLEMKLTLSAVKNVYPFIMFQNVTKDYGTILYNETAYANKGIQKTIDETLENVVETIPNPIHKIEMRRSYTRTALIQAWEAGITNIPVQVQQQFEDGLHWMEVNVILVLGDDGDLYSVTMTRQTDEFISLLDELEDARKRADAANKAKSMFLFNMSHDIRTPMTSILGLSELAQKHVDDQEQLNEDLANIRSVGENLLMIIDSVLEISNIENNKLQLEENIRNIENIGDRVKKTFIDEANSKNIDFKVTTDFYHPYVYVDEAKMLKIFMNSISNALKFTKPNGHVLVAIKQTLGKDDKHCLMELKVSDDGIGMSEEFQKHMFETFTRENQNDIDNPGTGLGLSILKSMVDLMHGKIEVDSHLGIGTTIKITIEQRLAPITSTETGENLHNDFQGKRILLVEDNDLNAEIAMELLADEGFKVERAEDGTVCISLIQQHKDNYFDAILMDIQMPIMDGYETTKAIRQMANEHKAKLPIIAMSANAFDEDQQKAIEAGMNDYVTKPIDMKRLLLVLDKYVAKS